VSSTSNSGWYCSGILIGSDEQASSISIAGWFGLAPSLLEFSDEQMSSTSIRPSGWYCSGILTGSDEQASTKTIAGWFNLRVSACCDWLCNRKPVGNFRRFRLCHDGARGNAAIRCTEIGGR